MHFIIYIDRNDCTVGEYMSHNMSFYFFLKWFKFTQFNKYREITMNTAIRHTECECTVSKHNSGKLSFVYKAQDRFKTKNKTKNTAKWA